MLRKFEEGTAKIETVGIMERAMVELAFAMFTTKDLEQADHHFNRFDLLIEELGETILLHSEL